MDKSQKRSDSECYTPAAETVRLWFYMGMKLVLGIKGRTRIEDV
jgi:hypothetical protein